VLLSPWPAGQVAHVVQAPPAALYLPLSHASQVATPQVPADAQSVPALQFVQLAAPAALYWCGSQSAQAAALLPSANLPAPQSVHVLCPPALPWPAPQFKQVVAPPPLYLFAAQSVQASPFAANWPAPQLVQSAASL